METFEHLRRANTVLLTTRRRDGSTVDTPVNLVVDSQGVGYFRTWSTSGKGRRLRNFPGVRIAPCSFFGRPQGSDQPALTSLLSGAEAERAAALLARRYPVLHGRLVPWIHRLKHYDTVHYRVLPADEPTPWTGSDLAPG